MDSIQINHYLEYILNSTELLEYEKNEKTKQFLIGQIGSCWDKYCQLKPPENTNDYEFIKRNLHSQNYFIIWYAAYSLISEKS